MFLLKIKIDLKDHWFLIAINCCLITSSWKFISSHLNITFSYTKWREKICFNSLQTHDLLCVYQLAILYHEKQSEEVTLVPEQNHLSLWQFKKSNTVLNEKQKQYKCKSSNKIKFTKSAKLELDKLFHFFESINTAFSFLWMNKNRFWNKYIGFQFMKTTWALV